MKLNFIVLLFHFILYNIDYSYATRFKDSQTREDFPATGEQRERRNPEAEEGTIEQHDSSALYQRGESSYKEAHEAPSKSDREKRFSEAVPYFKEAARMQNWKAQLQLGEMFEKAEGVTADIDCALQYYEAAAKNRVRDALHSLAHDRPLVQYCLAGMFEREGGVIGKNYQEAFNFYQKASKGNDEEIKMWARYKLSKMYEKGRGVDTNSAKAREVYIILSRKANSSLYLKVNYRLALLYQKERKYEEARKYLDYLDDIAGRAAHPLQSEASDKLQRIKEKPVQFERVKNCKRLYKLERIDEKANSKPEEFLQLYKGHGSKEFTIARFPSDQGFEAKEVLEEARKHYHDTSEISAKELTAAHLIEQEQENRLNEPEDRLAFSLEANDNNYQAEGDDLVISQNLKAKMENIQSEPDTDPEQEEGYEYAPGEPSQCASNSPITPPTEREKLKLKKLNEALAKNKKIKADDYTDFLIPIYRGVHYLPSIFMTKEARKKDREMTKGTVEWSEPLYSSASYKLAGKDFLEEGAEEASFENKDSNGFIESQAEEVEEEESEAEEHYEDTDEDLIEGRQSDQADIQENFLIEASKQVKKALDEFKANHPSFYHAFHQEYSNSHQNFHKYLENPVKSKNQDKRAAFVLYKSYFTAEAEKYRIFRNQRKAAVIRNPYISFSLAPAHAIKYALGDKSFHSPQGSKAQLLTPQYDTKGKPKHVYLGKCYIGLLSLNEFFKMNPYNVVENHAKGHVKISTHPYRNILTEDEVSFAGYVERNIVVRTVLIRCPTFAQEEYPSYYNAKYGINKSQYKTLRAKAKAQDYQPIFKIIVKKYRDKLQKYAAKYPRGNGYAKGRLVYPGFDRDFLFEPLSSNAAEIYKLISQQKEAPKIKERKINLLTETEQEYILKKISALPAFERNEFIESLREKLEKSNMKNKKKIPAKRKEKPKPDRTFGVKRSKLAEQSVQEEGWYS